MVGRGPLGQIFATASNDVLIYGAPGTALRELRWVSRDGETIGRASEPVDAWDLRIAPDGRRVAITEVDPQLRTLDVFIREGSQPVGTRLSLSTDIDESGVWSPDGLRIAWAGRRRHVMIRGAGAVLPEQTIASFDSPVQVWDWSRDGRSLLIGRTHADTRDDLWIQPPTEGAAAQPYVTTAFNQTFGVFSPDGRWVAYASDESGKFDIYIDSFPKPGSRTSRHHGRRHRAAMESRRYELYFRRGAEIHVGGAGAGNSGALEVSAMNRLFDAGAAVRSYDVSPDGRRFLINLPASSAARAPITHRASLVRLRGDASAGQAMKIATWNVNGIRARQGQLLDWLAAEKPDVVCLQEIKASLDQLPFELRDMEHYWSYWHGEKGYSGVALLVAKSLAGALPVCSHPGFDFEQRIACATVPSPAGDVMVASVYVPNGGKDFDAKMRFLQALETYVAETSRDGTADDPVRRPQRGAGPSATSIRRSASRIRLAPAPKSAR